MWELDCEEGWSPKNWCFWTVVLEKTLESPLDGKEIEPVHSEGDQPGISLGGMMLKLNLQYFGQVMRRVDSLEKTLMLGGLGAGGEGDDRGWEGWMASRTRWTWIWVNSGSWWWTGRPGVLRFMGSQRVGHDWVTELNWMMSSVFRASCSVVSDFFWPYGLQPVRLFCPWDSPDKNTGVGCYALHQGIFQTQRSNLGFCGCCIAGGFYAHIKINLYKKIFKATLFSKTKKNF